MLCSKSFKLRYILIKINCRYLIYLNIAKKYTHGVRRPRPPGESKHSAAMTPTPRRSRAAEEEQKDGRGSVIFGTGQWLASAAPAREAVCQLESAVWGIVR
jgi:hypothetical protein